MSRSPSLSSTPTVTVLLPVYNGGSLLQASLESVLAQTWTDFELLVINDGSTDETAQRLRKISDPRLRVLTNQTNLGLTRTLNRGLAEARAPWIARQDADDLSAPDRLNAQLAFFHAHPEVQLLGTSSWRITPAGRIFASNDLPTTHDAIRWASLVDNPFLHTSVMFRRAIAWEELGGYQERYSVCQDFALWNRIAARYPVANLPGRLVQMREHPSSMTQVQAGQTSDEVGEILAANWAVLFPNRPLSPEERRLLMLFRLRFEPEELPALHALLGELWKTFLAAHPGAHTNPDLWATRCKQSLRLGYKFLGSDRRVALGEIARAFADSPREWVRQGWATARCLAGWAG